MYVVCVLSWAEVSLLLRKPIVSEQDMLYTVAASEAGLMYIDQVRELHLLAKLTVSFPTRT